MSIKVGDALPEATLISITPTGPAPLATGDLFKGKKVVLFGVPGAYTGVCTKQHMPGYVQDAEAIKAKGVDTIACLAVNDAFVMGAWGKASNVGDKVVMLADGSGDYTRALGLETDLRAAGLGMRGQRFALIVDNGVVKDVFIEAPKEFKVSSAEHVLSALSRFRSDLSFDEEPQIQSTAARLRSLRARVDLRLH